MEDTLDSNSTNDLKVTSKMRADLKAAGPWMKFVGIFYIIVSAIGLIMPLVALSQTFHISIIIMLAINVLAIYMGTLVLKMGTNYAHFVGMGSTETLEKAFDAQKKFWMITGIFIIAMILLMVIGYSYFQDLQSQL